MSSHVSTPVFHHRRTLLALVVAAIGCGEIPKPDSLYVLCQGHDQLYWLNSRGQQTDQINVCVPEAYLNETCAAEVVNKFETSWHRV